MKFLSEKSREYIASWLSSHRPNFVVVHTQNFTEFFQDPLSLGIKSKGNGYMFFLNSAEGISLEIELNEKFNAFCIDKYSEEELSIVDLKNSIEIIEKYKNDEVK